MSFDMKRSGDVMSTILQEMSAATSAVVASYAKSVVSVHGPRARTSGFVWRSGLIVTADEALADTGEIRVTASGEATLPAQVVGRDPTTDIALLRVEDPTLAPAALATEAPPVGA